MYILNNSFMDILNNNSMDTLKIKYRVHFELRILYVPYVHFEE